MAAIRPAASPQEFDMLIIAEDMVVLMDKLLWIADIQFLGIVQFLMTETGRVGAQSAQLAKRCAAALLRILEVCRVRAINHEIGGGLIGGDINGCDSIS